MVNRKFTLIRVVAFCLLCAILLAAFSGLVKGLPVAWNQHLQLVILVVITYGLSVLFAKWEKLPLSSIGIVPRSASLQKVLAGFAIGMLMASLQPVFVLLLGHFKMSVVPNVSAYTIIFYLTLYILVAIREELAFRGYPLFSLYHRWGLWPAQAIIFVIFSLEHVAGGMTWPQAFFGAGTGALLFGFAALRTNGIALPAGLHAAWNFGQWCWGFKKETGILQGTADPGFENVVDRNGWISYLLIMAVAILLFYYYKPRNNRVVSAEVKH